MALQKILARRPKKDGYHRTVGATYCAQNSCSIANVRNVTEGLSVAGDEVITDTHRGRRDTRSSVHNRRTDNVSINATSSASIEYECVGLAVEHVLVHTLDVFLNSVIPDLALRVEVPRRAEIDEVPAAADVNDDTLGGALLVLLASDNGSNRIRRERVAGVHRNVMLTAGLSDFLEVVEVADNDVVGLEVGLELISWLGAAHECSHKPIRMRLLDSPRIGSWTCSISAELY